MKIPAKIRYAVRTLCEIGDMDQIPVPLSRIEASQKISRKYLKQILQPLEKISIIGSVRGKNGGYFLKKKLSEIRLLDIIAALEEDLIISPCLHDAVGCHFDRENICGSQGKWGELHSLIYNFYQNTVLSDFKDEIEL